MIPPRRPRGALRRAVLVLVLAVVLPLALVGLGAAPPAAAAEPPAVGDEPVAVVLDSMAPRVVTADGPGELVVTGRVVNRAAVPVRDVGVRLERGAALSGPGPRSARSRATSPPRPSGRGSPRSPASSGPAGRCRSRCARR